MDETAVVSSFLPLIMKIRYFLDCKQYIKTSFVALNIGYTPDLIE